MSMNHLLITDRQAVRQAFGKSKRDVEQDIEIIRGWLETQPHLPEIPNDNMIEMFLTMNKFSIEKTKQKIDMYYTIRSLLPEIYDHYNPLKYDIKNLRNTMGFYTPLPKPTPDNYRVCVYKIEGVSENFDLYKFYAYFLSVMEVRLQYDIAVGDVYILDYTHMKMGHMAKITPIGLKNTATILEKVFSNRVRGIHIINYSGFVELILNICKSGLKPKLMARIKLHKQIDKLYDYVPKEILPVDYGGDELSLKELNELWEKQLEKHADRFEELDKIKVREEWRPMPLESDDILGYHGHFKKLNVD